MTNIGTLPGDRLAGLSADLFHKVQKGSISITELSQFVQRKNPFMLSELSRNQHGHNTFSFVGLGLSGQQEYTLAEREGYSPGAWAYQCFNCRGGIGYNESHRLVFGSRYTAVVVLAEELSWLDSVHHVLQHVGKEYGYRQPFAGVLPEVRRHLSDQQMEVMGIEYLVALHQPIPKHDGTLCVLLSYRDGCGRRFDAEPADSIWSPGSAFVFTL